MPSRRTTSLTVVGALVLAAGATTLLPGAAPTASAAPLPPYGGCGELLEHYRSALARSATAYGSGVLLGVPMAVASAAGAAEDGSSRLAAVGPGATGTNLQEQGVDEPDVAKTVDGVLYAVAQGRLQLVSTGPDPQPLGSLDLGGDAYGGELLVQGDRVLVLLGGYAAGPADVRIAGGAPAQGTRLLLVDVGDPTAPTLLESLELTGRYLSARLSDGAVRLVTSSTPQVVWTQPAEPYGPDQTRVALAANVRAARSATLDQVLPRSVRRDATGRVLAQGRAVDCTAVRHAPAPRGESVLLLTTLDLSRGLQALDTTGVTTDGELVYASADRLYVATSRWGTTAPVVRDDRPETSTAVVEDTVTTELHAFDTTAPDRTPYAGTGSVAGYVPGRWALSSHDGHLRVATTSAPPWGGGGVSSSSVTVLAEQPDGLAETGRVEGLGLTERIYAVRYFGDLATVVTFRQTDPLYVLDLSDPTAPRVTGALKVPGFSTYLHPLGDDLLLGVGQDADAQGRVTGMQVSVFDLSDRSRPVQVDRLPLGQGYSPAGDDSRAFGYDPARRLVLLPFSRYDGPGETSVALGISVGADGRLREAGQLRRPAAAPVERVLHDAGTVYAVTQDGVAAGSSDALGWTGSALFQAR